MNNAYTILDVCYVKWIAPGDRSSPLLGKESKEPAVATEKYLEGACSMRIPVIYRLIPTKEA